jgi:UDPglucose--hexose-1-phosphate uridylyltransferase
MDVKGMYDRLSQCSEYRYDCLQRRWVIIASGRGQRPQDFWVSQDRPSSGFCPFCPGNEDKTPPEIAAVRRDGLPPNGPGWTLRVVPNKFPALRIEGATEREADGIYDRMNGIGAHEVVVETTAHTSPMGDRTPEEIARMLRAYRERLADLMLDQRLKYIQIFKNSGAAAGASLAHPHSQIIATTVIPRTVMLELRACREHHQVKERCLICDIIKQEISTQRRVVAINDLFIAFCSYAGRFPFEMFLAPRHHQHDFSLATDDDLDSLAHILRDVLHRLRVVLDDPPFNYILHSTPNASAQPRRSHYWETIAFDYHWHIELFPRLTNVAGFEWGTGFYINPMPPEDAARFLHERPRAAPR